MNKELKTVRNYLEDQITGEVIDMHNEQCIKCNECCSAGTVISEKEFKKLEKFLTKTDEGRALYHRAHKRITDYLAKGIIYFQCPFTGEHSKKCSIYKIRPQVCRDFHCNSRLNKLLDRPEGGQKTVSDFFFNKDLLYRYFKENL